MELQLATIRDLREPETDESHRRILGHVLMQVLCRGALHNDALARTGMHGDHRSGLPVVKLARMFLHSEAQAADCKRQATDLSNARRRTATQSPGL